MSLRGLAGGGFGTWLAAFATVATVTVARAAFTALRRSAVDR